IAAVCSLLWLIIPPQEPSYQGVLLSSWLSRAAEKGFYQDDPEIVRCRDAIRAIGTNAVPMLLRILRTKDSALKRKAMDLVERQHFVKVPIRSDEEQKQNAEADFYLLGEFATNAIPALIDVLQHPPSGYSRRIADRTLMSLYPAKGVAIPYWLP